MWGVGQARTASRGVGICGASLTAHSRRQGWPEAALTPLAIVSLVCLVARWPGLLLPGILTWGLRAGEVPLSSPFISATSFPKGKGIDIDYLFRVRGSGGGEAGDCWQGGAGHKGRKDGGGQVAIRSRDPGGSAFF